MKNKHFNFLKSIFLLLLTSIAGSLAAQEFNPYYIQVNDENGTLRNPWSGGMTAPQFSEIDVFDDSFMDLYQFDKDGEVHSIFINDGLLNQVAYTYDPTLTKNFPDCKGWVNLKDYNNDGIVDLFTFNTELGVSGIRVFKGIINDQGELDFEQYFDPEEEVPYLLFRQTPNSNPLNIYATKEDYPAFVDVDYDGDMDILNFGPDGTYVFWYKNISNDPEVFEFLLEDNCWGGFAEGNLNQEVTMNLDDPNECADPFFGNNSPSSQALHPGSTLLAFDEDGDQDYDILVGDVTNTNIIFLRNNGSVPTEWMTEQDPTYPSYDVPVFISPFPVAFYQDFDNDGAKDLLATNFNDNGVENYNMTWFYKNVVSDDDPTFELQSESVFTDQMLDFGTFAAPVFLDYNADGLMDLLVGTRGLFVQNDDEAYLILLENVGSESEPVFEVVDRDYLSLGDYTDDYNFAPCVGDMDGDEDLDILIGTNTGDLIYVENIAGPGQEMDFANPIPAWQNLDVGQNSNPFIIDLDRDGDMDLAIGERAGNLNFIRNIGTTEVFEWDNDISSDNNEKDLGDVDATIGTTSIVGNSAPFFFEVNGKYELILGTESGRMQKYADAEIEGSFTNSELSDIIPSGSQVIPAFADLNNNGKLEMVIGNRRGGLTLLSSDIDANALISSSEISTYELETSVYPNPVDESITIRLDANHILEKAVVYDLAGRKILESFDVMVNCKSLKPGVYVVEVSSESGIKGFSRFIKH